MGLFEDDNVYLDLLRERAYNLRWATLPPDVIPLTAADTDFQSAPEIAQTIIEYSAKRYFPYGPPEGLSSFRESVSNFFQEKRNTPVDAAHVLPVNSAAFGIYLVCKTILNPGDEAIIFDPVDFLFRCSIESVNGVAIPFPIPSGKAYVDFNTLEEYISPKTKLICLCNPLNPTGKVFTKEELTVLGTIAEKHGLTILSDEIWSDIVFHPAVFTSIASISEEIRKRTITVTGFSKSYGVAGLRIGAVIAHEPNLYSDLFKASLHQSTIHGVSVLSQIAATAALEKCGYWLDEFVEHLHQMRDLLVHEINGITGLHCTAPDGCYVIFVNIQNTGMTTEQVHKLLLNQAKVAVVPGLEVWFGKKAEGHIRICFSTSRKLLLESISRIKHVLK